MRLRQLFKCHIIRQKTCRSTLPVRTYTYIQICGLSKLSTSIFMCVCKVIKALVANLCVSALIAPKSTFHFHLVGDRRMPTAERLKSKEFSSIARDHNAK